MTVVTIILIAAIVAIATPIVTGMMNNVKNKSECQNGGGYCENGICQGGSANGKAC